MDYIIGGQERLGQGWADGAAQQMLASSEFGLALPVPSRQCDQHPPAARCWKVGVAQGEDVLHAQPRPAASR